MDNLHIHSEQLEEAYQQGRSDMLDSIIRAEKNKYFCVEDLCNGEKDCSDCRVEYLEQLKEQRDDS